MKIGTEDRVWILTRSAANEEALSLARTLADEFIPFAAVSSGKSGRTMNLLNLQLHIFQLDLHVVYYRVRMENESSNHKHWLRCLFMKP